MRRRAVFLDRDGVINKTVVRRGKPRAPDTVEEFEFFHGVREGVARLKEAGFLIVVVTNQPDVRRGWQTLDRVELMNELVRTELRVDALKVCYHLDEDMCACRKPQPGMLLEAAAELKIDLSRSFMMGDRFSDVTAGQAAGCISILVGDGDEDDIRPTPAARVLSLFEGADWIITKAGFPAEEFSHA